MLVAQELAGQLAGQLGAQVAGHYLVGSIRPEKLDCNHPMLEQGRREQKGGLAVLAAALGRMDRVVAEHNRRAWAALPILRAQSEARPTHQMAA